MANLTDRLKEAFKAMSPAKIGEYIQERKERRGTAGLAAAAAGLAGAFGGVGFGGAGAEGTVDSSLLIGVPRDDERRAQARKYKLELFQRFQ